MKLFLSDNCKFCEIVKKELPKFASLNIEILKVKPYATKPEYAVFDRTHKIIGSIKFERLKGVPALYDEDVNEMILGTSIISYLENKLNYENTNNK
jgi:hypothetical protein